LLAVSALAYPLPALELTTQLPTVAPPATTIATIAIATARCALLATIIL